MKVRGLVSLGIAVALASKFLLASEPAQAGAFLDDDGIIRGIYVQAEGGIALLPDQEGQFVQPSGNTPLTLDHENSVNYGGQLGVVLKDGFRIEAEGMLHEAERTGFGAAGTDTEVLLLMANLLYDMDVGDFPVKPYWGGGVGAAMINYNVSSLLGGTFDNETTNLAWQLTTGARAHVTDGLFMDVNYTYSRTRAPGVTSFNAGAGGNVGLDIQRLGFHAVRGGVGFEF